MVADPKMRDPRFARTVIFLCRHDKTGAFGPILNRPVTRSAGAHLLESLDIDSVDIKGDLAVRVGGPVDIQAAFLLHPEKFAQRQTICKAHGLAVTSSQPLLESMKTEAGPRRAVLFFGYAGWGAGQLEGELQRKDWIIIPGDSQTLMERDPAGMWQKALTRRGVDL